MAGKCSFLYTRIMILVVCFSKAKMEEHHCSSFPFERSTLEKMIRMEINVEGMEKVMKEYSDKIKETEERTKTVLEKLETKSEEMDKVFKKDQAQIEKVMKEYYDKINETEARTQTVLEKLETTTSEEMDKVVKGNLAQIERMAHDLVEFRNKTMNDPKDLAVTPLVLFRAINIADKSPANGQTLVFPTSVLNEGQGYDNVTGQFTAPTDGLYHLSVQLCLNPGKYLYYDIIVDNIRVNYGAFGDKDYTTCSSADTGVVMRRNMQAWVKCAYGTTSNLLYENNYRVNIFSGFLVHEI